MALGRCAQVRGERETHSWELLVLARVAQHCSIFLALLTEHRFSGCVMLSKTLVCSERVETVGHY